MSFVEQIMCPNDTAEGIPWSSTIAGTTSQTACSEDQIGIPIFNIIIHLHAIYHCFFISMLIFVFFEDVYILYLAYNFISQYIW